MKKLSPGTRNKPRRVAFSAFAIALLAATALMVSVVVGTSAGAGSPGNKVTLCHATGSQTNPFVRITVDAAGAFNGHLGHQDARDIIPPFTFNGQTFSQNWPAGQATFNAGCVVPTTPTTPVKPVTPVTPASPAPAAAPRAVASAPRLTG